MKITFENGWEHTDIHIDLSVAYEENYQMRMLENNKIRRILKVKGSGRDEGSRYTVSLDSAMISMDKYFSVKEMKKDDISRFAVQLLEAVGSLKDYLLNPDRLLLAPELVFMKEGEYYFCYLPVQEQNEERTLCMSFHKMTEYFVKKLDYSDTEGIFLVYRMHKESMTERYDLRKILNRYEADRQKRSGEKKKKTIPQEGRKEKNLPERKPKKRNPAHGQLSEGAVFYIDEEEHGKEEHRQEKYRRKPDTVSVAEDPVKYGAIKKTINKIKTGRWGEWDDLITEMDGQKRRGKL